ncbi:Multi antimicrobial extrusion protein [Dioscorea alata]|uniref:Multi antimicrobial extrusion protein n=1 Tax=Dioscorea alata TaxID=55571 RepID=A0ACB7VF75_DIOAL|nr:Multi antimicrobial extrusion protein [Dioscorea alata]
MAAAAAVGFLTVHPPVLLHLHSSPRLSTPLSPLLRRKLTPIRTPPRSSSSQQRSSSPDDLDPPKPSPRHRDPAGFSFLRPLNRVLDEIRADGIGLEILNIALPAVLALAADPIASLVDTAFVGHLGSVELAGVGVSVSIFNLVSKLFNIPLLNITTSFVAEEQALDVGMKNNSLGVARRDESLISETGWQKFLGGGDVESKKYLPAVSMSLALAAGIGIAEAIALALCSGLLMNFMGIPVDSPMRVPAEKFLSLKAYGAPAIVVALAAQGTFRGFMDTKTPLYAVGAGNLLNVILDVILIVLLGLGVEGAAIATVISEYLIASVLLWKLNTKVILIPPNIIGTRIVRYLKSGGLLIGRTIAALLTMTISTSMAAREGPVPMAGHQICLQVWLAVSLLNDAIALAGQALLAREFARGNYKQARLVIFRVLQVGAVTGIALATFLFFGFSAFSEVFTTDSAVLDIARSGVWFVSFSQPINALAFVFDGLYYGVSDFAYAAYSMVLVGLIASLFFLTAVPYFGLGGLWTGLILFMSLRAGAGFWRLGTKGGPWKMVWSETEVGLMEK